MRELKNQIDTLIRFDKPIEKTQDHFQEKEKSNEEVIEEILIHSNLSGENASPDIDTLLNIMIPPIEFQENEKKFIQYVSHSPGTREDVIKLQQKLDEKLISRQAKDHGICPIREELHLQCFNEILRQATIDCPERGLLLMRVRDEMKMTISAYQTLFKSADAFGMRKQIEAQKDKHELKDKLNSLKNKKEQLENRKNELIDKKQAIELQIDERRNYERTKRKQDIDFLEYQNQHLKTFFQNLDTKQFQKRINQWNKKTNLNLKKNSVKKFLNLLKLFINYISNEKKMIFYYLMLSNTLIIIIKLKSINLLINMKMKNKIFLKKNLKFYQRVNLFKYIIILILKFKILKIRLYNLMIFKLFLIKLKILIIMYQSIKKKLMILRILFKLQNLILIKLKTIFKKLLTLKIKIQVNMLILVMINIIKFILNFQKKKNNFQKVKCQEKNNQKNLIKKF